MLRRFQSVSVSGQEADGGQSFFSNLSVCLHVCLTATDRTRMPSPVRGCGNLSHWRCRGRWEEEEEEEEAMLGARNLNGRRGAVDGRDGPGPLTAMH